jgi:hypothetical protein
MRDAALNPKVHSGYADEVMQAALEAEDEVGKGGGVERKGQKNEWTSGFRTSYRGRSAPPRPAPKRMRRTRTRSDR